jgi:MFS family permease
MDTIQGLYRNRRQFALLVVINAFVGGMVGIERSIFPELAEQVFSVASATAMLSFIAAFGLSKALANYFTGRWADRVGRRNLLIIGWVIALPVPFMLMWTNTWTGVVLANVLLGISQGLTWSSTVVMKIDLVGEQHRGLAMGLNEFAGYLAVGVFAFWSAFLADRYGLRPYPFYLGIGLAVLGLLLSVFWLKDTRRHVAAEGARHGAPPIEGVFRATSWSNPTLRAITQAGFVNNLNDGMVWGLLPVYLATLAFNTSQIGWIAGIYPLVWGIAQLFTGKMGDHYPKKTLLFWGMLLQGVAIVLMPFTHQFAHLVGIATALGLGTALVYPNFLTAVSERVHPAQRAESIGTFRLWRDLGYVVGAVMSGFIADAFGLQAAILCTGALTLASAGVVWRQYGQEPPGMPRSPYV